MSSGGAKNEGLDVIKHQDAGIGLIGSAGKSTLLNTWTNTFSEL